MKKFYRIIACALALILTIGVTANEAKAATLNSVTTTYNDITTTTTETATERTSISQDKHYKTISVYNKDTEITNMKIYKDNELVNEIEINPATIKNNQENSIAGRVASTEEKTFSNFEYQIWYSSPAEYELRRPDGGGLNDKTYYFRTYRTSKNGTYFDNFKSTVDAINTKEGEVLVKAGAQGLFAVAEVIIIACSGGFGVAVSAFVSSAGFGVSAATACIELGGLCDKAIDYYWNVYTNSTIHFEE